MGSKNSQNAPGADIDAALKTLFEALASAPTPPTILKLVEQLEQGAIARAAEANVAQGAVTGAQPVDRRAS